MRLLLWIVRFSKSFTKMKWKYFCNFTKYSGHIRFLVSCFLCMQVSLCVYVCVYGFFFAHFYHSLQFTWLLNNSCPHRYSMLCTHETFENDSYLHFRNSCLVHPHNLLEIGIKGNAFDFKHKRIEEWMRKTKTKKTKDKK